MKNLIFVEPNASSQSSYKIRHAEAKEPELDTRYFFVDVDMLVFES